MANDDPVDFVIITALPEERDAVFRHFKARKLPKDDADFHTYYEGRLQTERPDKAVYRVIVTCLANMGPQRAAAKTAAVVKRWTPRHVLLVGIAGGVEGEVDLGDVLIAEIIADYTLGKVEPHPGIIGFFRGLFGASKRKVRWQPYRTDANLFDSARNLESGWEEKIKAKRPDPGKPSRREGVIASGGDVVAFEDLIRDYQRTWGKLIGVEMEAGGTASVLAEMPSPPRFFMVRSASDFANPAKNDPDTKRWREYAYDVAGTYAIALLTEGPVAPTPRVDSAPPSEAKKIQPGTAELRARDLRSLREFWTELPTDQADYFFERAGLQLFPYSILYVWEGIKALTESSGFHIYDTDTRDAVDAFVRPFLRTIARTEFFRELPRGQLYKFIQSHEHSDFAEWSAELKAFQENVESAQEAYRRLITLTRERFPEIDLEETSREARERRARFEASESGSPAESATSGTEGSNPGSRASADRSEEVEAAAAAILARAASVPIAWIEGMTEQEVTLGIENDVEQEAAEVLQSRGRARVDGRSCTVTISRS